MEAERKRMFYHLYKRYFIPTVAGVVSRFFLYPGYGGNSM